MSSTHQDTITETAREMRAVALLGQRLSVRARADVVLVEDGHHTSFLSLIDGYHAIKGDQAADIDYDISPRDAAWLTSLTSMSVGELAQWIAKADPAHTYPPAHWLARYMAADLARQMWVSWDQVY